MEEEGRWTVWNESLPGYLVSLIPLAMLLCLLGDTKVDLWMPVEEWRISFSLHERSLERRLITVCQDCRAGVCHREEGLEETREGDFDMLRWR